MQYANCFNDSILDHNEEKYLNVGTDHIFESNLVSI